MQTPELAASTRELAARMRWTLARVGELINEARAVGWAEGDVMADVEDSDSVLHDASTSDTTPMGQLALSLGLSATELDVLWLLVCIELDPALSCAARHLIAPGMNELSAQMIERLVAPDGMVDDGVLDRLIRLRSWKPRRIRGCRCIAVRCACMTASSISHVEALRLTVRFETSRR